MNSWGSICCTLVFDQDPRVFTCPEQTDLSRKLPVCTQNEVSKQKLKHFENIDRATWRELRKNTGIDLQTHQ